MPKHGNIFTNWFKTSKTNKQKHKKSQPIKNQSNVQSSIESISSTTIKRSPLVPRAPTTNDNRNELSPRRRTSIFGLTFGLASSTGSSRLSLLSGNSKQTVQHKSTSCIETQCYNQNELNGGGSILKESFANIDNRESMITSSTQSTTNNAQIDNSQSTKSPATPPRKQSKSNSITSVGFFQQIASQLHPGRTSPRSPNLTGSAHSSLQNLPSGSTSPTNISSQISTTATNQTNCTTTSSAFQRNPSFKQTSAIFNSSSLDKSSAFTPISTNNQKNYLQRQAITQQEKQIQFQKQHHSTNQSYSFQKIVCNQSISEFNQMNSTNVVPSSNLITTINESFTESNQDSSDAEIVEVFGGDKQNKTQTGTLDLIDEQLLFNDTDKVKDDNRPCSPAPFNLTPNEKELKKAEQNQPDNQQDKNNNQLVEKCDLIKENDKQSKEVKKKTSFADENNEDLMFTKCKLNHRDTLRDNLKDSLIDNLKDTRDQTENEINLVDKLGEESKALKRKSIDLVDTATTDQQEQQSAEDTDSFGELVNNEEDFSFYENRTGLGDDLKFLASMPELCDITFLVGENREPVCAVSAVLGSRSR